MRTSLGLSGAALMLLGLLAAPESAAGWQGLTGSNPHWSGPAPYALQEAGSEDLGGFEATQSVLREGFEDWTRVSCTGLALEYRGATAAAPGSRETVAWAESTWPHDTNAIGVTSTGFSTTEIVAAAMLMNGVNFTWVTGSGSGSQVNAYSIITHEAGHYLGLGHSSDRNAIMYFAYAGGISAINGDDETGICTLYPEEGTTPTGCAATGCPTGQTCADGRCVDDGGSVGSGATCDSCTSDAACGSGSCMRYPDDLGYCGDACSTDEDCGGSNELCQRVSDGLSRCIRRQSDGTATCAIDAGTTSPEPEPVPEPSCTESRDCGDSEHCEDGACVPDGAGGAVGDACGTNTDCESGLCAVDSARDESFCTIVCAEDGECPSGHGCEDLGGGMSACTPTGTPTDPDPGFGPGGNGERLASGLTGGCSATGASHEEGGFAILFALVAVGAITRRRRW